MAHKPLERELLTVLATHVTGRIADLGCGPGHATHYLHEQGCDVVGVDLSLGMLAEAHRRQPDLLFIQGDLRALPFPAGTFAGAVAFYTLIHLDPIDLPAVLREIRRILVPGGYLLVGFHQGNETVHRTQWWDQTVDLDFHQFPLPTMRQWLADADYTLVRVAERAPLPEIEFATQRAYVLARTPSTTDPA